MGSRYKEEDFFQEASSDEESNALIITSQDYTEDENVVHTIDDHASIDSKYSTADESGLNFTNVDQPFAVDSDESEREDSDVVELLESTVNEFYKDVVVDQLEQQGVNNTIEEIDELEQEKSPDPSNAKHDRVIDRDSQSLVDELDDDQSLTEASVGEPQPKRYYLTVDGNQKPIHKAYKRKQFWSEEEVQLLEEELNRTQYERSWQQMTSDAASCIKHLDYTPEQIRAKARNEYQRRLQLDLPLGGFRYYEPKHKRTKRNLK